MRPESEREGVPSHLAGFSDRVLAFSLDIALFVAGYGATLKLFFPSYSLLVNPHAGMWSIMWTALFLLYQAYSSCEGRRSVGKAILGLRIVSLDREPLELGSAIVRSSAYLVSSIFNLGFLWSLFNPARQCWHDMVAGSIVIEDHAKAPGSRMLVRAGAAACLAFFAGLSYWNNVAGEKYSRILDVAYAQIGLREISSLERIYHHKHGAYASHVQSLAPLTRAPVTFMRDVTRLFDPNTGVVIKRSRDGYRIEAHAMDASRTLVALNGP